nr:immunoglobulin heavy chain junction region [Macaca mulatta]
CARGDFGWSVDFW